MTSVAGPSPGVSLGDIRESVLADTVAPGVGLRQGEAGGDSSISSISLSSLSSSLLLLLLESLSMPSIRSSSSRAALRTRTRAERSERGSGCRLVGCWQIHLPG